MTTDRSTEMPKYPARLHAQKVIAELVKLLPEEEKGKVGFPLLHQTRAPHLNYAADMNRCMLSCCKLHR